jgi:hypothetical protein
MMVGTQQAYANLDRINREKSFKFKMYTQFECEGETNYQSNT